VEKDKKKNCMGRVAYQAIARCFDSHFSINNHAKQEVDPYLLGSNERIGVWPSLDIQIHHWGPSFPLLLTWK
jgi:hypothetical protein